MPFHNPELLSQVLNKTIKLKATKSRRSKQLLTITCARYGIPTI